MKKFTFAFSCLLLSVFANAQSTTPQATTGTATAATADISKVLDIKEAVHNFGKIPYGKPAEFDVVIKNVSSDSIRIDNVKAGCGCTTPKWQPGPYAPGETFKVTMGFNGYTEGPFEKLVDIIFSNGMSKQVKFFGEGYKVAENPAPANGAVQKMKNSGK
ncbi:DUF1573 domain-containing protein [Segetibacter sp. 3557_3]|uniref:DUF1573 domain-containing protein n=1 Tax=Segetibacter sp. 3557_3 TaxID=2547429 RepID=UPI001058BA3B|nr:DUF1573 domain-containing protein [Segetibacter sp. 3557_3]TDH27892.1 DUF1573 domain-containing protein [Segetibacter sp. 3557_3]